MVIWIHLLAYIEPMNMLDLVQRVRSGSEPLCTCWTIFLDLEPLLESWQVNLCLNSHSKSDNGVHLKNEARVWWICKLELWIIESLKQWACLACGMNIQNHWTLELLNLQILNFNVESGVRSIIFLKPIFWILDLNQGTCNMKMHHWTSEHVEPLKWNHHTTTFTTKLVKLWN